MAIMCPEKPKEFTPSSQEGFIYECLKELPDEYYVFHSFTLNHNIRGSISEHEIDFLIFNPQKGILCIEAKAGQVNYSNGAWRYGNGNIMEHDGPFKQASNFTHNLMNYIRKDLDMGDLVKKCKFMYAVCFPNLSYNSSKRIHTAPDANCNLVLFKESLDNIEESISKIFDCELENVYVQTLLSNQDKDKFLDSVLCPTFNLMPILQIETENRNKKFCSMLKEQIALLDYLEEQRTAVISGAAGTGKTLMAYEKARRHAEKHEKVLFLCYNSKLREYLVQNRFHPYIDYYTIDGFACKICNSSSPDYESLEKKLFEFYSDNNFPYMHIIIDEGQDFGRNNIDENGILDMLSELVSEDKEEHKSFYLFYDKNQLIQGKKLPDCISDADCKLTLYKNCRNTEQIAITSMRFLGNEKQPKLFQEAIKGNKPLFVIENDKDKQIESINYLIEKYKTENIENIVILTSSTVEKSILSSKRDNEYYHYKGKKYLFTTCRKFKGLEAEAIILIDVSKETLDNIEGKNIIYVGSSRAKLEFSAVLNFSNNEICEYLDDNNIRKGKIPYKSFATAFNAKLIES